MPFKYIGARKINENDFKKRKYQVLIKRDEGKVNKISIYEYIAYRVDGNNLSQSSEGK